MEKPAPIHLEAYRVAYPDRAAIPVVAISEDQVEWDDILDNGGYYRVVAEGKENLTFHEKPNGGKIITADSPPEIVDNAFQHPGDIVVQEGFDLERELHPLELPGPIVEYGGPTPDGYRLIKRLGTMPEANYVANLSSEMIARLRGKTAIKGAILSDVMYMAQRNESVGAIMYSALGGDKPVDDEAMASEIDRVLAPGGLVVAQYTSTERVQQMLNRNLQLKAMQIPLWQETGDPSLNVVMQKPLIPSNG